MFACVMYEIYCVDTTRNSNQSFHVISGGSARCRTGSEQSRSAHPASHRHVPLWHSPCPMQSLTQAADAQSPPRHPW